MNKPLYYLASPYQSIENNILKSMGTELELYYKGIQVINPLTILPNVTDNEKRAMKICKKLLLTCDALILSGNWENSRGCIQELNWTIKANMEVFVYRNGELINVKTKGDPDINANERR